jgi:excisionase family DNA binding protein
VAVAPSEPVQRRSIASCRFAEILTTLGPAQEPANLLTVAEVAERLQVSVWTAYRKIEAGVIPAVRLGSGKRAPIRVSEAELEWWLFEEPQP